MRKKSAEQGAIRLLIATSHKGAEAHLELARGISLLKKVEESELRSDRAIQIQLPMATSMRRHESYVSCIAEDEERQTKS